MTNEQRDIYMMLLQTGRENEALRFRDRCEAENQRSLVPESDSTQIESSAERENE